MPRSLQAPVKNSPFQSWVRSCPVPIKPPHRMAGARSSLVITAWAPGHFSGNTQLWPKVEEHSLRGRERKSRREERALATGWLGRLCSGKRDSAAPRGAQSSFWFRGVGPPQLSAQHLAYVGQLPTSP